MKVVGLFLFLFIIQNTALASRAIISSNQSFYHSESLISFLLIPTLMDISKDQILMESGATNPTSTSTGAAFVGHKQVKDQWLLLAALGEQNDLIGGARARFNAEFAQNFVLTQNPVHLFVAHKFWGQSLVIGSSYSKYENKTGIEQEKSGTASLGYRYGLLHFNLHLAVNDKSTLANGNELYLEQPMQFIGLYELDSAELALKYESYFQKHKAAGIETSSEDQQSVQISYYDFTRIQDIQFNYRIEYSSRTVKNKLTDIVNRVNSFPVTLGFEHQIVPWINLMASVKQHLFVNQGTGVLHTPNTTNVNVGVQLLYNDVTLDALVSGFSSATANQNLDGANLFSQVSLTYKY